MAHKGVIRHILILSLLFVMVSCHKKQNAPTIIIPVDINENTQKEVSIYDICSEIHVIGLDTTQPISNDVYSGSTWMDCDGEHFYILDENSMTLHEYDMDGQLVSYANRIGRGPGEYTMACQIHYNMDLGLIEVLNPLGKIMRYTRDSLDFHSELSYIGKGPLSSYNYLQLGNNYIIYSFREGDKIWLLNSELEEISSFAYQPPTYLKDYLTARSQLFTQDGQPYVYRTYDGAIEHIDVTKGRVTPYIEWDFGGFQAKLKDVPKDNSARDYGSFMMDYSTHKLSPFIDMKACGGKICAMTLFNGGKIHTFIYDLEKRSSLFFEKTKEGLSFFPEVFVDEFMYKYVDSANLPSFVSRELLDSESQKEYDKIIANKSSAILKYKM